MNAECRPASGRPRLPQPARPKSKIQISFILPQFVIPHSEIRIPHFNMSADRIDKWLWATRLFKTRSLAAAACKAGVVEIAGRAAKPAHDVRAGETVCVRQGLVLRTLRVLGIPPGRVGAKLVASYCEDLTPPSEFEKAREQRVQQVLAREKGSGRPTKRDRRALDRLFGQM